jgi:hypothetical protein
MWSSRISSRKYVAATSHLAQLLKSALQTLYLTAYFKPHLETTFEISNAPMTEALQGIGR